MKNSALVSQRGASPSCSKTVITQIPENNSGFLFRREPHLLEYVSTNNRFVFHIRHPSPGNWDFLKRILEGLFLEGDRILILTHGSEAQAMVIFLPSFVLPGLHLIWFSTGLFPLQPGLPMPKGPAHEAIYGEHTAFCFLSLGTQRSLPLLSSHFKGPRKVLCSSGDSLGKKTWELLFAKCSLKAKSSCSLFFPSSSHAACSRLS